MWFWLVKEHSVHSLKKVKAVVEETVHFINTVSQGTIFCNYILNILGLQRCFKFYIFNTRNYGFYVPHQNYISDMGEALEKDLENQQKKSSNMRENINTLTEKIINRYMSYFYIFRVIS